MFSIYIVFMFTFFLYSEPGINRLNMTISMNAIIPIFCNAMIIPLQRNFWLFILIEKINSKNKYQ